jgi:hypothetical protein
MADAGRHVNGETIVSEHISPIVVECRKPFQPPLPESPGPQTAVPVERVAAPGPDTHHTQPTEQDISDMTLLDFIRGMRQHDPSMRRSLAENYAELMREREAGYAPLSRGPATPQRSICTLPDGGSKLVH